MSAVSKTVRRSVALPSRVAKMVKALAKNRGTSANSILLDLIEKGLHSKEEDQRKFFQLAERLQSSPEHAERQRIKRELARLTFGE